MDSEREYRCLACQALLVGKIRAHLHVREKHAELLDMAHIDEFLVFRKIEPAVDLAKGPPFHCRHCEATRMNEVGMREHLYKEHQLTMAVYASDYIGNLDLEEELRREQKALEGELNRALNVLESVVGVADFLTECGEEAPEDAE